MEPNFDLYNKSITAHEKTMRIGPSDFERIMGYKDGGYGVKTSGWCKRSGGSTTREVYVGKGGRIWLGEVWQRIEETVKVDDEFLVGFVLFTLGTLLCPPSAEESLSLNFLVPLRDTKTIK